LLRVDNSGVLTVGASSSLSSVGSSQITSSSSLTNSNIVLNPKGSGAIIGGPVPDGTTTGGDARGTYAIDFQLSRTASNHVASGSNSCIIGGLNSRSNGATSSCIGAENGLASGQRGVVVGGIGNSTSGTGGISLGGDNNTASSQGSLAAGSRAVANLISSQAFASGRFSVSGDAQTLSWRYFRQITGTGIQELTLDGSAPSATGRAVIVSNRLYNVNLQLSAICSTVGNGTLTLGDSYVATYQVGIKRLVNTTTLVGTPQLISTQSDPNMSTSAVTISADDTNECLKVEFTPPTGGAAGSTTVIRVVVTATATVVGY
jgi:hypothetical protein